MKTITPVELNERLSTNEVSRSQILDVRTPIECREVHIDESRFLPLDSLNAEEFGKVVGEEQTYMLCRTGKRASRACEQLSREGLGGPIVIEGGILAWEEAGLPVVKGKSVMSLERQVRVAAGGLVVVGALLGFLVHPYWHALSGFVGAGLVFAGITNTCGMGMALARMPWNQDSKSNCPV